MKFFKSFFILFISSFLINNSHAQSNLKQDLVYTLPSGLTFKLNLSLPDDFKLLEKNKEFTTYQSKTNNASFIVTSPMQIAVSILKDSLKSQSKKNCEQKNGKYINFNIQYSDAKENNNFTNDEFLISICKASSISANLDFAFDAANTWGFDKSSVIFSLQKAYPKDTNISDKQIVKELSHLMSKVKMQNEY